MAEVFVGHGSFPFFIHVVSRLGMVDRCVSFVRAADMKNFGPVDQPTCCSQRILPAEAGVGDVTQGTPAVPTTSSHHDVLVPLCLCSKVGNSRPRGDFFTFYDTQKKHFSGLVLNLKMKERLAQQA